MEQKTIQIPDICFIYDQVSCSQTVEHRRKTLTTMKVSKSLDLCIQVTGLKVGLYQELKVFQDQYVLCGEVEFCGLL